MTLAALIDKPDPYRDGGSLSPETQHLRLIDAEMERQLIEEALRTRPMQHER